MDDLKRQAIIKMLQQAYTMEVETAINYLSCSLDLEGMMAEIIKSNLSAEVQDELGHAQQLGQRIKVLGGRVPGSLAMDFNQQSIQMGESTLDIKRVVLGVIDGESHAISHYQKIIEACESVDPVTQDLCISLKGDEEGHLRKYRGFLAELEQMCFKNAC